MATTSNAYGTPEHCIGDAAVADIFHYLNLPMIQTGGVTESKIVDEQAAIESSMQIISNALVGGHLVHDVGFIDAAMSASLDQIVMCDEIISYARRFARGFEVNDETLAIDVIQEVGPAVNILPGITLSCTSAMNYGNPSPLTTANTTLGKPSMPKICALVSMRG